MAKLIILLISVVGVISCEQQEKVLFTGDEYQNIMQYIYEDSTNYASFIDIVEAGNMVDVLSSYNSNIGGSRYTLFLPNNEAVDKFIQSSIIYNSLEEIIADSLYSKELVKYHLLNSEVFASDFPNGALPTRTLSEDFLTIRYFDDERGILFYLNNEASITTIDIEKSNGTIHLIDKMLSPVVYTAYEWVKINEVRYSIFAQLLDVTGMSDTLNYFEINDFGLKEYSKYTLLVESDELYKNNGINSFNELAELISPNNQNYTDSQNKLNAYARYHVLTEAKFLADFQPDDETITSAVYDTYGDAPISVDFGADLKFNVGTQNFEPVVENGDTVSWINYLLVDLDNSNILTKSGAIHQLDRILMPFIPGRKTEEFQFFNDYLIGALSTYTGSYRILNEDLTAIELEGTEVLLYVREGQGISGVRNRDYISVFGNLSLIYTTPRLLAGNYKVSVIAYGSPISADFVTYFNDKPLGGIVNLRQDNSTWLFGGRNTKVLGNVSIEGYTSHKIEFKTLFVGRLMIDRIIFEPI